MAEGGWDGDRAGAASPQGHRASSSSGCPVDPGLIMAEWSECDEMQQQQQQWERISVMLLRQGSSGGSAALAPLPRQLSGAGLLRQASARLQPQTSNKAGAPPAPYVAGTSTSGSRTGSGSGVKPPAAAADSSVSANTEASDGSQPGHTNQ